jgi:hypothetical protein
MATPTYVQGVHSGREGNGGSPTATLKITLPNPSPGGNALCLGMEFGFGGGCVSAVADDKGNTWVNPKTVTTGGQQIEGWYTLNTIAGTQVITVTFTVGAVDSASFSLQEWRNVQTIGAIGPTGSDSSTSPSITPSGAITAGDLVWMFGTDITTLTPSLTGSIAAGTNFSLYCADRKQGRFVQTSVTQSGSGACTLSVPGTDSWNSVLFVLHSASAGNALPAGIKVQTVQFLYYGTTSQVHQVPCFGNLLVGMWSAPDVSITVTDSNSNTWNAGTTKTNGTSSLAQICYAPNLTASPTMTLTATYSGSTLSTDQMLRILDVVGAATSPHDVDGTGSSGLQTTAGNITSDTITPSAANELVVSMMTQEFKTSKATVTDANGHTPTILPLIADWLSNDSGGGGTGPSHLCEDDGCAFLYNADTTQITFIYAETTVGTHTGIQHWAACSSAFKAPAAGPTLEEDAKYFLTVQQA